MGDIANLNRVPLEAMAWAFQTGVYTMQEIADFLGIHYSTVSRAVRRLEARSGAGAKVVDCKT